MNAIRLTEPAPGKNGYIGYWNGKEYHIYAESSYAAQTAMRNALKPSKAKAHLCTCTLAQRADGSQVEIVIA